MVKFVLTALFIVLLSAPLGAETVYIPADRDNTLFEDPAGGISNGSGPVFFVGRSSPSQSAPYTIRRGVIHFDVAQIPYDAIIKDVSFTLHLSNSSLEGPETTEVSLHRLLDGWGEGASNGTGGTGALAQEGDATWIHTYYPNQFWAWQGGYFVEKASAREVIASLDPDPYRNFYTWKSQRLLKDVQDWVSGEEENNGWILIGDESIVRTARRFDTRENTNPQFRPVLFVTYRLPGQKEDPVPVE